MRSPSTVKFRASPEAACTWPPWLSKLALVKLTLDTPSIKPPAVLLTSPVYRALKQAAPQVEIDALVYRETVPMLERTSSTMASTVPWGRPETARNTAMRWAVTGMPCWRRRAAGSDTRRDSVQFWIESRAFRHPTDSGKKAPISRKYPATFRVS